MSYIRKYRDSWRAEVFKCGQRLSKCLPTQAEAETWASLTEAKLMAAGKGGRVSLEELRLGPDLITAVPRMVVQAVQNAPHPPISVLAAAIPCGEPCGIYFLFREGEVVYVGQSLDMLGRVSRHRREGKQFDAFAMIECEADRLDELERLYIHAFVPEGNLTLGNSPKRQASLRAGTRKPAPPRQSTPDSAQSGSQAQAPESLAA